MEDHIEEHIVELNKDIILWSDKYQKYFPEGTFFNVAKHTTLGDDKFRFTLNKLCFFLLPYITNIKEIIDECSLSPELITELLVELIINISDDNFSLFIDNKILINHSVIIIDKLVEQIKQTDNYDFSYVFNNFYNHCSYTEKIDCRKIVECCDKTGNTLLMWLCSVENTKYKNRNRINYFISGNIKYLNLTSLNENNDTFLSILIKNKYRKILYAVIETLSKKKYKKQFDFLMMNVNKQNETILYLAYKCHSDYLVYEIHEKYSDTVDINIEIDITGDIFCKNNLLNGGKIGNMQSLLNWLCLRKYYGNIIKIINTYPTINIGYADIYGNTLLILLCRQLTFHGDTGYINKYHDHGRNEDDWTSDDDNYDNDSDTDDDESDHYYDNINYLQINNYIQTDPQYNFTTVQNDIINKQNYNCSNNIIHKKILYTIYFIIEKFADECNAGQPFGSFKDIFRKRILLCFLCENGYFILAHKLLEHCSHSCNLTYDDDQASVILGTLFRSINKYEHVKKIFDIIIDKKLCSDEAINKYIFCYIDLIYDRSAKSKLEYTTIHTSTMEYIYSVKLIHQYKHILKTTTITDKSGLYLLMQLPFVTLNDIKCLIKNYKYNSECMHEFDLENKFIIKILNICFEKNLKYSALKFILKLKNTSNFKFNINLKYLNNVTIYTKNIISKICHKTPLLLKQINISKYYKY
jgi:hypothetical protein